jgi:hypothetical protein
MNGLIVDAPPIDNILVGKKTWEMRSTVVKRRGLIALIRKGSGQIVGVANLTDCKGPLSTQDMLANISEHLIAEERIRSGEVAKWRYAWVMKQVQSLPRPVRYTHPSGAVIWVNLDDSASKQVLDQI